MALRPVPADGPIVLAVLYPREWFADQSAFDAAKVRAAFTALQSARQSLETAHFELLLSIRELLSLEQWQALQEMHEEVVRRRAERERQFGEEPAPGRPGLGRQERPGPQRRP